MAEDDAFNLDDVMEIFGGAIDVPAKEKAPVAVKPPEEPVVASAADDDDDDMKLSLDEMAILAKYEENKKKSIKEAEEAKLKKEEEARKILEAFEVEKKAKAEKEAAERKALEAKQKADLEALKHTEKLVDEQTKAEEEARIIAEFEREMSAKIVADEQSKKDAEARAQQELKALQEKEELEKKKREADEEKLKEDLSSQVDVKKAGRLQELMAKAQKEIGEDALAPLKDFERPSTDIAGQGAGPGAAAGVFVSRPDTIDPKQNEELLAMLDESRKTCFTFLAPLIGIRATNNMLAKTVEKARKAYPLILKDINWRSDGEIRDDGSIDGHRLYKNFNAMPAHEAVDQYLDSMAEICNLRIKSVEMGLGAEVEANMKKKLAGLAKVFANDGLDETTSKVFFSHVLKM